MESNRQTYRRYTNRKISKSYEDKEDIKKGQVKEKRVLNEPWEWYDKCARRERNKGEYFRAKHKAYITLTNCS